MFQPTSVPGRTPESPDQRAFARMLAEEIIFGLQNQNLKVRQTNVPVVQRVEGRVSSTIDQFPQLIRLVDEVVDAVYRTEVDLEPLIKAIESLRGEIASTETPAFPEFPKTMAAEVRSLPKYVADDLAIIKKRLKEIAEKELSITTPEVNVSAPDLSDLKREQEKTRETIQNAVRSLEAIEAKEYPETDFEPLKEAIEEVRKTIQERPIPTAERMPRTNQGYLQMSIMAEDVDNPGTFLPVQGQYNSSGSFVLLTNASSTTPPSTSSITFMDGSSFDFVDSTSFEFLT